MSTNKNSLNKNKFYMLLALKQAKKAIGNTGKNPSVGCVIVKNNSVISSGVTGVNGRPHAERYAIQNSKYSVKNSDLYVTLEPCSHYGVTPPCINIIIKKSIKSVFFSTKDPDIRSFDKSTNILKLKKILTSNGILEEEIKNFYKSYFKYKKKLHPYVTAKLAISKDFFTVSKNKSWITNEFSRGRVHLMRSQNDCILTSVKTVIKDNPLLTCRIKGLENRSPIRFIIDKNLKIPLSSKILLNSKINKTYIFFNKENLIKENLLKKNNIILIKMPLNKENNFNLNLILKKIAQFGFSRVFLESGVNLMGNFLRENLIDEFKLFISSNNLGRNGRNNFKKYIKMIDKSVKTDNKVNLLGDKLISYTIK